MADADPHAEPDERRYDAALMRRLLRYIAPYRWLALLAVLLAKLQREERFLRAHFPGYADYARATARLVPGVW